MLRAWTCRACLNLLFCDIAGEEETNLLLRLNQKILVDIRTKESLVAVVLHQTKDMILKITRMSSLSFFNGRDSSSTKCAIFLLAAQFVLQLFEQMRSCLFDTKATRSTI